eukprot:1147711-Pelagomonas_calceolata.AAC.4
MGATGHARGRACAMCAMGHARGRACAMGATGHARGRACAMGSCHRSCQVCARVRGRGWLGGWGQVWVCVSARLRLPSMKVQCILHTSPSCHMHACGWQPLDKHKAFIKPLLYA